MLTYIQINAAKPAAKHYLLRDGQGLYLQVKTNGSKLWRMNYRYLDKQKTLHLGKWPEVVLASEEQECRRDFVRLARPAIEASCRTDAMSRNIGYCSQGNWSIIRTAPPASDRPSPSPQEMLRSGLSFSAPCLNPKTKSGLELFVQVHLTFYTNKDCAIDDRDEKTDDFECQINKLSVRLASYSGTIL